MKFFYTRDIDCCMPSMPAADLEYQKTLEPGHRDAICFRPNPTPGGPPIAYWPKGAVRELKGVVTDAVWHCQRGVGEPADEECATALNYTPEQLAKAQHVYQRIVDGIHPDDWPAYDFGAMVGYLPDGKSWKPGPKFNEWTAAAQAQQQNDEGI